MLERLQSLSERFAEIEGLLARPEVATDPIRLQELARERASLEDVVGLYEQFVSVNRQLEDALVILDEGDDEDLRALAQEELSSLERRRNELEDRIRMALLPKDRNADKDVIVEIRAGTGGEEAALFAGDLYRMYARYAQAKGWGVDVIDSNPTGIGGFKEVVFEVKGRGAFSRLKHESGGHRVQRVPTTETQGRIHTSAATVAVLPEAEEVDVEIDPSDLRIDIFHASGHGGQNVQKVATAVRIIHNPTGIVAVCQDERSQLKNRQRAMAVLRARLLDREVSRQQEEMAASRRSQVGSGDRSEKVRTYNFPQNRVTDHRIGVTSHNLERILLGELDEFIDELAAREQARLLQEA
ncbi:MAG: peptide chain release factor 1 [Chloroflexota bacterium]|nr:peptide chain release factor 1 [Chloroflexota bacterium]MDE2942218.1 peptide chain release factor 1 [Chloroflexota bacterium]